MGEAFLKDTRKTVGYVLDKKPISKHSLSLYLSLLTSLRAENRWRELSFFNASVNSFKETIRTFFLSPQAELDRMGKLRKRQQVGSGG